MKFESRQNCSFHSTFIEIDSNGMNIVSLCRATHICANKFYTQIHATFCPSFHSTRKREREKESEREWEREREREASNRIEMCVQLKWVCRLRRKTRSWRPRRLNPSSKQFGKEKNNNKFVSKQFCINNKIIANLFQSDTGHNVIGRRHSSSSSGQSPYFCQICLAENISLNLEKCSNNKHDSGLE